MPGKQGIKLGVIDSDMLYILSIFHLVSWQVDFESLYALNAELYKKVEKPTSKIPTLAHVNL